MTLKPAIQRLGSSIGCLDTTRLPRSAIQRLGCLVGSVWGNQHLCIQRQSFLASNVYAGQHPKPQHWAPTPKETLHWFPDQNSQLLHPTGNSALVLLTGKATLDSASGSFKQQFPLNLHSVSVGHFASISANWRISSVSRGFGLLGFCLPRIWIHVLRRSLELSGSIASFLQVSSTCADRRSYCNVRLLTEHQVRLFHF